ncbi:MAG: ABC transporter ATP-binding protein [Clostridiales bacterium]|nr:ABC transporter ATP-binding protein [Clostridiales bacterium]
MIELENVSKTYGEKKVLDNISLKINEGELVAITGESGKGKSTILNILGLLETTDSGQVLICGQGNIKPNSSKATKVLRNTISYLFQNFALIDEETVNNNLLIALKYVKGTKKDKLNKISEVLKIVGLEGFEKRKVYELSGGEQQRVAIARIMLKPSKIVLADEPTGSLDEVNRDKIFELLKGINKDGKTVVIVTHDKYLANKCNKVISL